LYSYLGLPLHKNVEDSFDDGTFVIVPVEAPKKDQPVEWKVVLTKKTIAKQWITATIRYQVCYA
jgi:hypothetical protein